jgi:siroheme synthase-like protein
MSAHSYPIQLNLAGRPVLVAGAGRVATRKIERLVASGAHVLVVSLTASGIVQRLAAERKLELKLRAIDDEDARGRFLVIAATDDPACNARLADAARRCGALVSRVDAPEASDFILPACARGAHVEATISTHGAAPSASRRLGRELTHWIQAGPDRFAAEIARARVALRGHPEAQSRLRTLSEGALFEACQAQDEPRIQAVVASILGGGA